MVSTIESSKKNNNSNNNKGNIDHQPQQGHVGIFKTPEEKRKHTHTYIQKQNMYSISECDGQSPTGERVGGSCKLGPMIQLYREYIIYGTME